MFSVFEMSITYLIFHAYIILNLEAYFELCDMSIPDFSILQTLPTFVV